jgi:regulator of protease activity HflC (stomatin/prohibitin superfamily)
MDTLITIVVLWVLFLGLIIFIDRVGITWLILELARRDVWWSPFRMRPAPGHIIMMTKGKEPGGPFAMVVAGHIPHWHYHKEDRQFYKEDDSAFRQKFPSGPPRTTARFDKMGVVMVGLFRRYYTRKRRWESWDLLPGTAKYGIVRKETKKEEEHIFFFSTTVAVDLETVPTKDNYPAQMKVVENFLLINPEKAEFVAGKWEIQGIAATRARAREYIASKTVHELRDERDDQDRGDFVDAILRANEKHEGESGTIGLVPEYGVMIQGPYYIDFDLESGDKEMTDAMKRQMIAKEDVITARTRADEAAELGKADANRRREEAAGIRATVAAWGTSPAGAQVAMAEAIKSQPQLRYLSVNQGPGGVSVAVPEEK